MPSTKDYPPGYFYDIMTDSFKPIPFPISTPNRLRVYTASKLDKAKLWVSLRAAWPEVEWTAHWPDVITGGMEEDRALAPAFWFRDVEDVRRSDALLCFGDESGALRGGLVEAGVAIGLGKPVLVIGQTPCYSTWQFHPLVQRVPDLESARRVLAVMAGRLPEGKS